MAASPGPSSQRLVEITLDQRSIVRWSPEIDHERKVAIFDLLEENYFAPVGNWRGPYALHLAIEDNRLVLDIRAADGNGPSGRVLLPLSEFRRLIKDYFTLCESYFEAIKSSPPSRIEALDMGRRGFHDEGSALLKERLAGKIEIDFDTARRLFTLICVLRLRG